MPDDIGQGPVGEPLAKLPLHFFDIFDIDRLASQLYQAGSFIDHAVNQIAVARATQKQSTNRTEITLSNNFFGSAVALR